jgi:MoaA/NifB/PqqE/SkfB family radical SAM enzyme
MKSGLRAYCSLAGKIMKANTRPFDVLPYKLTMAVTYRCNFKCSMCSIWKLRPVDELTLDEIRLFFQKNNYFSWVDITGGEIFLRDDVTEILSTVIECCPNLVLLHFPTNGSLTSRVVETVRTVAGRLGHQRLVVTVSLDGDQQTHDRVRGVPGSWARSMATFQSLRDIKGVKAFLGMTLLSDNVATIEDAFTEARSVCGDLTYNDFHVNIYHKSTHYYDNYSNVERQPGSEEVRQAIMAYGAQRRHSATPIGLLENMYLQLSSTYLSDGVTPLRCRSLSSSCFIDPWGNVFPCTIFDVVIGKLREEGYDLRRILFTEKASRLKREIADLKCPQCWTPCEAYQSILGNLAFVPIALVKASRR